MKNMIRHEGFGINASVSSGNSGGNSGGNSSGNSSGNSGVDSVPELAQRNATNLTAKMIEVNTSLNLTSTVPGEATVASWIAHAKTLNRIVSH